MSNSSLNQTKQIDLKVVSSFKQHGLELPVPSDSSKPTEIEKKHVYEVYDKISTHFSFTRYKPWPQVAQFLLSLEKGALVADVGCGNGKYLGVNKELNVFGTDRSANLLQIAGEKNEGSQLFVADSLRLPVREGSFDGLISIAVIHHFSSENLRIQALKELFRVVKKGGLILIYVWAFEQTEKKFTEQDNFVPWHLQNKYENNTKVETLENGPRVLEEKEIDCKVYQRYYHVFKKGELEEIIKKAGEVSVVRSYYDHANWCCVVRKE